MGKNLKMVRKHQWHNTQKYRKHTSLKMKSTNVGNMFFHSFTNTTCKNNVSTLFVQIFKFCSQTHTHHIVQNFQVHLFTNRSTMTIRHKTNGFSEKSNFNTSIIAHTHHVAQFLTTNSGIGNSNSILKLQLAVNGVLI